MRLLIDALVYIMYVSGSCAFCVSPVNMQHQDPLCLLRHGRMGSNAKPLGPEQPAVIGEIVDLLPLLRGNSLIQPFLDRNVMCPAGRAHAQPRLPAVQSCTPFYYIIIQRKICELFVNTCKFLCILR